MPSLGEILDVKLSDDVTPAELLRRLNAVSLAGIEFLAATMLQESQPALGRILARAQYAALLPDGPKAATAVQAYASGASLLAARRERQDSRKSAPASQVDVRPFITDVAAASAKAAPSWASRLGWQDADPDHVLTFGVVVSALGSARPVEVVEALTHQAVARQASIARLGLWAAAEQAGGFADPLEEPSPAGNIANP
jgi:hypothetical protein